MTGTKVCLLESWHFWNVASFNCRQLTFMKSGEKQHHPHLIQTYVNLFTHTRFGIDFFLTILYTNDHAIPKLHKKIPFE